jgi:SAM-dependent methyltransferase
MAEFWEEAFKDKQAMWGFEPAQSALIAKKYFLEKDVKHILIPGVGYGRNAKPFIDAGIRVTGIEISKTAIEMASKHCGNEMKIFHGSVTDMPFDNNKYDGIFCFAVIHLLGRNEREKLIQNCYNQLSENGYMFFTASTKESPMFGKGRFISKDRYEFHEGAKIFYYDRESVQSEFGSVGLFEIVDVNENQPFF